MANRKSNLPPIYRSKDNPNKFKKGDEKTIEAARRGGKASQEKARKRREMRETLEILLNMQLKKGTVKDVEKLKTLEELSGENVTAQDAILYSMILTAMNGGRDGVAAFKQISEVMNDKNDVTTLDVRILNGLSQDDLKKLADTDDDDDDFDDDLDDYDGLE